MTTLGEREERITKALKSGNKDALAIGEDLKAIRDERQYKYESADFNRYTVDKWGMVKRQALNYIQHYDITETLKSADASYLPPFLAITRAIAEKIHDPDQQVEFWKIFTKHVGEEKLKAKHVRHVAMAYLESALKENTKTTIDNILRGDESFISETGRGAKRLPEGRPDEIMIERDIFDTFHYDNEDLMVLRNFIRINPLMRITSESVSVMNTGRSRIGFYEFKQEQPAHKSFGIDVKLFLDHYNHTDLRLENTGSYLIIHDPNNVDNKMSFQNKADRIPPFDNDVFDESFEGTPKILELTFTQDFYNFVLNTNKAGENLYSRLYFRNNENGLVLTLANNRQEMNDAALQLPISDEHIVVNDLESRSVFILISDLNFCSADYDAEFLISEDDKAGVCKWYASELRLKYYFGCYLEE